MITVYLRKSPGRALGRTVEVESVKQLFDTLDAGAKEGLNKAVVEFSGHDSFFEAEEEVNKRTESRARAATMASVVAPSFESWLLGAFYAVHGSGWRAIYNFASVAVQVQQMAGLPPFEG